MRAGDLTVAATLQLICNRAAEPSVLDRGFNEQMPHASLHIELPPTPRWALLFLALLFLGSTPHMARLLIMALLTG